MRMGSNYDAIVLDMEDALVDQSMSVCTAISKAIDAYLVELIGVKPSGGPVYSPEEVQNFAIAQGFEDEHDTLHALLIAALHLLSVEFQEDDFDGLESTDLLEAVRKTGKVVESLHDLAKRKNLQEFAKLMRQKGGGRKGLARARGIRNRWLALAEGHIMMDNFVKRVLAEAYLGDELFLKVHGYPRRLVREEGTIGLEKLWIEVEELANIRKRCPLAVVTKRTQAEAQFLLEKTGISRLLEVVIGEAAPGASLEDEASWIKALGVQESTEANYSTKVTEAVERMRWQEGLESLQRVAYVGNCTPEVRGIQGLKERFRLIIIGCAFGQDKRLLALQKERGADFVVADAEQLARIITEKPRPKAPEFPGMY